jgi:subtilisin family serine protease
MSIMRSFARAGAGTLFTVLCAAAPQPAPERGGDPDAERVAIETLARQLGAEPETLSVAAAATARYPNLDLAVWAFKVADKEGALHGISVDSELRPVDPERLALQEQAALRDRFGALEPALAAAMERSGHDLLPVSIWARDTTKRRWDRPAAQGEPLSPDAIDELYTSVADARAADLEKLIAPVLERVRAFDPEAGANDLAPVLHAKLSAEVLRELARDPAIDAIYQADLPGHNEMNVVLPATGINTLHQAGITGRGVKVAFVEGLAGQVDSGSLLLRPVLQDVVDTCPTNPKDHATAVAGVMVGRRIWGAGWEGTAPNVELRAAGSCSTSSPELQNATTRAVRWGTRIVSLSWGINPPSAGPAAMDRFYDDIVLNEWRSVTKSAGNSNPGGPNCFQFPTDGTITSPGRAYNIITVGGFDDKNTAIWFDDSEYVCSSRVNPPSLHNDREKPELAAPAVNVHVVGQGPANMIVADGTSFAAPAVAGLSALLIEKNSTLSVWPEVIRATLMATALNNIEGSTRLSDIDGAGGIDAASAASLIDKPQQWGGQFYGCSTPTPLVLATVSPPPRTRHRVVLSWDTDPAFAEYATRPSADIDLRIRDSKGNIVQSSLSFDNTYEIVEFESLGLETFTLEAVRFRCNLSTWLGWAWHTFPKPGG